ncbi:unnamed protein product [Echinostoma caproni]|uniref:Integrase_H2C2 domain-containing protein n=1 Tax=Echinostoma caproni TaxID=27848 RepID=A0A183BDI2_9TREM|nr:unnamed protein product [Echinostoma caproni]
MYVQYTTYLWYQQPCRHHLSNPYPEAIDLQDIATVQTNDTDIERLRKQSMLRSEHLPLPSSDNKVYCDVFLGHPRPVVPSTLRRKVFETLHNLSHPGIRASVKLITDRVAQHPKGHPPMGIPAKAYNPTANRIFELFHRQLKSALVAQVNPDWEESLPPILLGCRSAFKADMQSTSAELTFGRTLRLPGEMVEPTQPTDFNYSDYAARLVHRMRQLHIQPLRQQTH